MKYNEWRDELKSNLLSVSDAERQRVLDYYAEAYADRREAGFSERQIIDEFGAPYDAAQRILNENIDDEPKAKSAPDNTPPREERNMYGQVQNGAPPPPPKSSVRRENSVLFIVLCVIFCVPLFGLIMALVGITVGLCVAPFALVVSGAASMVGSIVIMAGGEVAYGFYVLGGGLIALGIGIILLPLFGKIVKIIWNAFRKAINAIRNTFTGKEQTV